MNAERLLFALSQAGDAPDRIQQLRKIIVALAISGRLDAGSAAMQPSEILQAVECVKDTLVKQGALPKQRMPSTVLKDQLPENFSDPARFAKLGTLARIEKGQTGIQQAQPGAFPLVVTAAERTSCDHYDFDGAAAIIPLVSSTGHGNASLNRLHYQDGKFALGTILAAVFPHDPELVSARFLFEYLTAFKEELLVSRMTGTANVTLTLGGIADVPVPLVCPNAQAKVDELMALCDELEAARAAREAAGDRLAAASLARLNTPDPATFQSDARFALDALPALTARPDQIKQLRQTILNLAVRGKLVPQEGSDEDAFRWVLRMFPNARAGGKKSKETVRVRPLDDVEADYTLPTSWTWMALGSLVSIMDAGWSQQCENDPRKDAASWGVLKTTAVQTLAFDCQQHKELPSRLQPRPQYEAKVGDILITRAGPKNRVGISCAVDRTEPRLMISDKLIRLRLVEGLSPRFFALTLNAGISSAAIEAAKSGMAVMQMNISQEKLRVVPVPLPPLPEQHRIVARVDELMAICDQLEARLTTATTTRSRLLDALLAEALAPAEDREMEAAE